jgi:lauroyl/myristoyl acyltransferase
MRFSYACHRIRGLNRIGKSIAPLNFYKYASRAALLNYHLNPGGWRRTAYLRQALHESFDEARIDLVAKKHLQYRQWQKTLALGWPNWADRWREWTRLEGGEHLQEALSKGQGALLLSGHSYGFNAIVAPLLGQMGFQPLRTGRGGWDARDRWGRDLSVENWEYNAFGENLWQHTRALNKMRRARRENTVIHFLVTGFPNGRPELELDFYYERFFLDETAMRIIEALDMPVLPCFATCDAAGRVIIEIHPPVAAARSAIMQSFGALYSRRLKAQPEFAFFWRKLVQQKPGW